MAGPFTRGRWFKRADGVIFRMDDPDHITRMLDEGWHEVTGPAPNPIPSVAPVAPDIEAARAAFGLEPRPPRPHVKPIRKVKETSKETKGRA